MEETEVKGRVNNYVRETKTFNAAYRKGKKKGRKTRIILLSPYEVEIDIFKTYSRRVIKREKGDR